MHRQVGAVANRLSLRAPQRRSLEILDRVVELGPPSKTANREALLAAIQKEFPGVTDFERDFPSLCFALATGVGKTRLMGAFISYLRLARGIQNFFVLAPNLTIYNKLIADFTPNTPKYVFRGIAEFATDTPLLITGENYDQTLLDQLTSCRINVFNISKINSEVRGGKAPRIKRLSEYIGERYFDYLANLPDLVLLMDESHRYRATAGVKAINELNPILGLELTATPFTEGKGAKSTIPFKNIIYSYRLADAMADGFVKEPAVVTRRNFRAEGKTPEEIEKLKLEDGVHLHEGLKVELDTYHRETGMPLVKPFVLVIARDTTHAADLKALVESDAFFDGRYKGKVLQVDSSNTTGAEGDETVERLLRVEHADEPTEIVIHVNMLKEGWDVTNLFTIVPLRTAKARTLVEQSIGRGLRLPFGDRTGITALDRLSIVAHDRFDEIIADCNAADSPLKVAAVVLDDEELARKTVTVISPPTMLERLGISDDPQPKGLEATPQVFTDPRAVGVARTTLATIEKLASDVTNLPTSAKLSDPAVRERVVEAVQTAMGGQLTLGGMSGLDVPAIVAATCDEFARGTIDIPRVSITPIGTVQTGFNRFTVDTSSWNYQPLTDELFLKQLRTGETSFVTLSSSGIVEPRLENYVVAGLIDFDDVPYDENADLLYDLANQAVKHFLTYLSEDDTVRVLRAYQRPIAVNLHAQMHEPGHYWEKVEGYHHEVRAGFTPLKQGAYSASADESVTDFKVAPRDKTKIQQVVYGGFARCLYRTQRFQANNERLLAIILDRDSERWFKPLKDQFQIFYRVGTAHNQYVPDFVAETKDTNWLIESKARNQLQSAEVQRKKEAAEEWCGFATAHTQANGGKPWKYALIPDDVVDENMSSEYLVTAGPRA
jgi:type III restriction enzyme